LNNLKKKVDENCLHENVVSPVAIAISADPGFPGCVLACILLEGMRTESRAAVARYLPSQSVAVRPCHAGAHRLKCDCPRAKAGNRPGTWPKYSTPLAERSGVPSGLARNRDLSRGCQRPQPHISDDVEQCWLLEPQKPARACIRKRWPRLTVAFRAGAAVGLRSMEGLAAART